MARSPLFRLFALAHRAQRASRHTGVPADEIFASAHERRLSRRSLLKAGAVVAAAPLLKACPAPPPPDGPAVGIVGGGIAGLHCAYRLNRLGLASVVYDAQNRFGGRMFTDRDTFSAQEQHCELGGELIDTGHATMLDLAEELDIELLDYLDEQPGLSSIVARFDGANVAIADILAAYAPIAAAIDADLATLTGDGFVTFDAHNNGEELDALSLRAWFDARGIDESNIARRLWDVAYNIEYGLETDVTNCLNMLFLTSTDTATVALFGESDERFHAKNGSDAYIQKLAESVGNRTLNARLVRISRASDGRVRLTFETGTEAVHERVVLALPFSTLRDVEIQDFEISPAKRLAIDEVGYGTNAKLMVGFNTRVWRDLGSDGSTYGDTGFQSTWETSRLQPGDAGIITNYVGGQPGLDMGNGTPESQGASFLGQWEEIFPGVTAAHNGKVARFHWPTSPFVKGSYSAYKVGQYTTITGSEIGAEGPLHFCGEHTSLDAQGYMEGAALTGAAAAVEVAEALGVSGVIVPAALVADGPEARILARAGEVARRRRWLRALGIPRAA